MTVEVKSPDAQMSENSVGEIIKVVDEKKTEGEGEGLGSGEDRKYENEEKTEGVDVLVVAEREVVLEDKFDDNLDEKKSENVEKAQGGAVETNVVTPPVVINRELDVEKAEKNENAEKAQVGAAETNIVAPPVVIDREVDVENVEKAHGGAAETNVVVPPTVVDREVDVEREIDEKRNDNVEKNESGDGKAIEEKEVDVERKIDEKRSEDVEKNEVGDGKTVEEKEVDVEEKTEIGVSKAVEEREIDVEVEKKVEGGVVGAGDEKKNKDVEGNEGATAESSTSISSDMTDIERKALTELKMKVEEAILQNNIFKKEKPAHEGDEDKSVRKGKRTSEVVDDLKDPTEGSDDKSVEEVKNPIEDTEEKAKEVVVDEGAGKDISLWGVPLLPSKGVEGTNVVLLKFLRARDFKVNEAFDMLTNTLQWRKEYKCDSLLDEEFSAELNSVAYMDGFDSEGHPICFNIYAPFQNNELYQKTFGDEEQRTQLLRWRVQLMEKSIRKLDFSPGGISSLLQINDLNNAPGLSKKELRLAAKQAVALLQDNYPEFVARNIFINVPFWFYAFYTLLSPFLSQRTKSKIVFSRPSNVIDTLLRHIPANEIPTKYGGLKRDNESQFTSERVSEVEVKAGSTELIEIPAPKVGATLLWDLTVLGWEVTYKEEFVPSDEKSYTLIVRKPKKVGFSDEPTRNSFTNKEPGKVVITIENGTFKKKRVLYRYKVTESKVTESSPCG